MRTGERMKGNDDRSPSIRCRPGVESSGAGGRRTWLWVVGDGGDRGARRRTIFAWQRGQRDDAVAAVTFNPIRPSSASRRSPIGSTRCVTS